MKLLTNEQQESYENSKIWCICKEKYENRYLKDCKVRDHCHYTGEFRVLPVAPIISNIVTIFQKGSNYDYDFTVKEFTEEF